jgi:hypothetical protein
MLTKLGRIHIYRLHKAFYPIPEIGEYHPEIKWLNWLIKWE